MSTQRIQLAIHGDLFVARTKEIFSQVITDGELDDHFSTCIFKVETPHDPYRLYRSAPGHFYLTWRGGVIRTAIAPLKPDAFEKFFKRLCTDPSFDSLGMPFPSFVTEYKGYKWVGIPKRGSLDVDLVRLDLKNGDSAVAKLTISADELDPIEFGESYRDDIKPGDVVKSNRLGIVVVAHQDQLLLLTERGEWIWENDDNPELIKKF